MPLDVIAPDRGTGPTPGQTRPRVGVLFGQQVTDLDPLVAYGRLCAERDARLWLGQSLTVESHLALAALAGRGVHVQTGLGVAVAPLTTPSLAWSQASSVARLMGRGMSACYGIGSLAAAASLRGQPLTAPARWMQQFLAQVADLRAQAADPPPSPGVEIGCGVLRPTMARHAAAVADVVVTWLTPLGYLASSLAPALAEGAAAAGRSVPRVVAIVPCSVRRPGRDPVRLAATAIGQHIRLPHYAAMLCAAGADLRGERAHDLRAALQTGVFAFGSPEEIAAAVIAHGATGADEVVLHVGGVGLVHGHDEALDDLRDVMDAVDSARPAQPAAAPTRHTDQPHPAAAPLGPGR